MTRVSEIGLLCPGPWAGHSTGGRGVHSFFPITQWGGCCSSSQFAGKEAEAGRGAVAYIRYSGDNWSRN